jgi:predicted transcriptional regulator
MITTTTVDVRRRRERLGVSRLTLAIKTEVSPAWVASIEGGWQPAGSRALARVEAALDRLQAAPPLEAA